MQIKATQLIEVDTLFIGGGPATLGVLTNAYQTSRLDALINHSGGDTGRNGIAIVEASDQFGGGSLQKLYGIQSNTSATGFLKVIMYPKTNKTPSSPQKVPQSAGSPNKQGSNQTPIYQRKPDVPIFYKQILNKSTVLQKSQVKIQPQKIQRKYFPQFQEFSEGELVQSLQRYGKKCAPLQLIGTFLSYAGNQMLNDIYKRYSKKIFYANFKGNKIQQFKNGDETYWLSECTSTKNQNQKIVFKSNKVVLATGAKQLLNQTFRPQYGLKNTCMTYTSDQVLKYGGFCDLVSQIKKKNGNCNISILGGSHSAFSIIYLLLNGPCKINYFEELNKKQKYNRNIKSASLVQNHQNSNKSQQLHGFKISICNNCASCPYGLNHSVNQRCMCGQSCGCLGQPKVNVHNSDEVNWPILTGEDKIKIIYRKQIKVHYGNQAQAAQELYNEFDKNLDLSKGGIVYPFTGIRGDSKELWNRIKKGQVKHVELVKAMTVADQASQMSQADIVIQACGYASNQLPVLDNNGKQFTLLKTFPQEHRYVMDQEQYSKANSPEHIDVNTNCMIMNSKDSRSINGLYGIGQGFSLATNDPSVQAEQRIGAKADSVGLYIKQIGNKILQQVIPNHRIQFVYPQEQQIEIPFQPKEYFDPSQALSSPGIKFNNSLIQGQRKQINPIQSRQENVRSQKHTSQKIQMYQNSESQSKNNLSGQNQIRRNLGAPFTLHSRYFNDFITNNTGAQVQMASQAIQHVQQGSIPLLKQSEMTTTAKLVQDQFFAQSLQAQQQMNNSPLMYSDKKYRADSPNKKTILKRKHVGNKKSANKNQQLKQFRPKGSMNPNQLESLIDHRYKPIQKPNTHVVTGGNSSQSIYHQVLQHGSQGFNKKTPVNNLLFINNNQLDPEKARTNFTNYEDQILNNHNVTKSRKSIGNQNTSNPHYSFSQNESQDNNKTYSGQVTNSPAFQYGMTDLRTDAVTKSKTHTTEDDHKEKWQLRDNQYPFTVTPQKYGKSQLDNSNLSAGYPPNTFPLRGGGAAVVASPKTQSNLDSPTKQYNKTKSQWIVGENQTKNQSNRGQNVNKKVYKNQNQVQYGYSESILGNQSPANNKYSKYQSQKSNSFYVNTYKQSITTPDSQVRRTTNFN